MTTSETGPAAPTPRGPSAQPARGPTGLEAPTDLPVLLRELCKAREVFAQRRHGGAPKGSLDEARADMVAALRSYTSALSARRLPVPYLLRDELRLYQGISTRG